MIKTTSMDATVSVVWYQDPALDQSAMVDPETLGQEPLKAVSRVRENAPGIFPASGQIQWTWLYHIIGAKFPGLWRDIPLSGDSAPTEFIIGAVPPSELNRIEDESRGASGVASMHFQCFKAALRDIKNGPHDQVKGKPVVPKVNRAGVERVDPEWIEQIFIREARTIANDIGQIAWGWNQLGGDDAKN